MEWRQFKAEMPRDPVIRREYDALETEYRLINSIIQRKIDTGLSSRQIADRTGLSIQTIEGIEGADGRTTLSQLKRVAEALECKVVVKLERKKVCLDPPSGSVTRDRSPK
jgi:transcriptional regulator with XRE-family HTH domain